MAIPASQLQLNIKNTSLTLSRNRPIIRSFYQVFAQNFDALIAETFIDQNVDRFDQFDAKDDVSYKQALTWFNSVVEWHKAQTQLNDYSLHDANLSLSWWTFEPDGDDWVISHPVSGEFSGVTLNVDESGRPTLKSRLQAIGARVLPPSTWGFAESESPEEITVNSIAVSGADSYNVYNDLGNGSFVLLGNVPDNNYRTLTGITAGGYRVRIAAVTGGVVGILGNENIVQVQAVNGAQAFSAISAPKRPPKRSTTIVNPSATKPSLLDRIKSRLGR